MSLARAARIALSVGSILLLLWLTMPTAMGAPDTESSPIELPPLFIGPEEISSPGLPVLLVSEAPMDTDDVLDMTMRSDRRLTEQVRQAHSVYFSSAERGVQLRIRLIEFTNRYWAETFLFSKSTEAEPNLPPGSRRRDVMRDGVRHSIAVAVKGRFGVVVSAIPLPQAVPNPALQDLLLARALPPQLEKLPLTEDLHSQTRIDLSDIRRLLIVLPISLVPILAVATAAASLLRDRGLIERILGRCPTTTSRCVVEDLTHATAQLRRRARLRNLRLVLGGTALSALVVAVEIRISLPALIEIALVPGSVGLLVVADLLISAKRAERHPFVRATIVPAAVGIFGSLAIMYAAAFLFSAAIAIFVLGTSIGHWLVGLIIIWLGFRTLANLSRPFRYSKRLAQTWIARAASEQMHENTPGVFLLRSFQDDDLRMRMRRSTRHNPIEFASAQPFERFEELLAWSMWRFGPVRTVGIPGTDLAPLGAAREYHSDDNWEDAVRQRLIEEKVIVFVVGRSRSLMTEVSAARELGVLGKCLFVFPPESDDELHSRALVLSAALGLANDVLAEPAAIGRYLIGLYLSDEGRPVLLTVDGRDDAAYQTLFNVAGTAVADRPALPIHDVAVDLQESAVIDVSDELVTYNPDRKRPDPPGVRAGFKAVVEAVRLAGLSQRSSEADIVAVRRAREELNRLGRLGDWETIYDRHITPFWRANVPRSVFVEKSREHSVNIRIAETSDVSVCVRGRRATTFVRTRGRPCPPPTHFVNVDGSWLVDPR
ncbi:hypothetical protein APR12_002220 [Nocardia amikacinitolerans]|uniref:hypothetical protein n=1 Tax=Nocardia amikacinitolerans TaxID=756689 RepID=UPI00082FCC02|nr:hypothetical protein [Nocardia amikacinitolerans]MCP2316880.1 hypothetical protein [Nocardia amikacinitolerans]